MKQLVLFILPLFLTAKALAQSDEKITYQAVQQQCSGFPLEKRARMSVTRFSVTTRTDDPAAAQNAGANNTLKALSILAGRDQAPRADDVPATLADNMTTMLTNALQGVNCFRVLESLKNNADLTQEIEQGTSKLSSKKAPKAGKQLGAQIVATGEVIEYSVKAKGMNIAGVGTNNKLVKLGFNVKLINPETRDIISSKVFRVQSKNKSSVSVLGVVSTANSDPAVAAVMEDGIIKAVEFIAHIKDSLNITADNIPGSGKVAGGDNEIEITLNNSNFASFNALSGIISNMQQHKSMEKAFSDGVGSYSVVTGMSADAFLDNLTNKLGNKFEVTGFDAGKIELKAK